MDALNNLKKNWRKLALRLSLVAASGAVGAISTYLTKNPEVFGPVTGLVGLGAHELGVLITKQEKNA
jgi:hypothetical protein